jgi:hypothetical protein
VGEETLRKGLQQLTTSGLASCQGDIPNAVYTFSHAMVQDAAYDSLLKSRRKQLHRDVASLLQQRWPAIRETAPSSSPSIIRRRSATASLRKCGCARARPRFVASRCPRL